VLAYARLEKNRAISAAQDVTLAELIARVEKRLAERAAQAGMQLEVSTPEDVRSSTVHVDPSAVEQILFNLVDNACKYAVSTADRRIRLETLPDGGRAMMRVRDYGPGIAEREARKLFRPFCKSSKDAANSSPGVGLGLALSRRLARHMGGISDSIKPSIAAPVSSSLSPQQPTDLCWVSHPCDPRSGSMKCGIQSEARE